jgi:predicted nucleic acid-binding protein
MPVKVVDASALGAIAFGEPEGEAVAAMLSDSLLVAPLLLWFELSNICLKKIGKQPDQKDRLLKAFQLAQRLPIEMMAVDYIQVINLADEKNLTTYDANYLWIAQKLGGDLVTLDLKLRKAAKKL